MSTNGVDGTQVSVDINELSTEGADRLGQAFFVRLKNLALACLSLVGLRDWVVILNYKLFVHHGVLVKDVALPIPIEWAVGVLVFLVGPIVDVSHVSLLRISCLYFLVVMLDFFLTLRKNLYLFDDQLCCVVVALFAVLCG